MVDNRKGWTRSMYLAQIDENNNQALKYAAARDEISWKGLSIFIWVWFLLVWTLIIWIIGEILIYRAINKRKEQWNIYNNKIIELNNDNKILNSEMNIRFDTSTDLAK